MLIVRKSNGKLRQSNKIIKYNLVNRYASLRLLRIRKCFHPDVTVLSQLDYTVIDFTPIIKTYFKDYEPFNSGILFHNNMFYFNCRLSNYVMRESTNQCYYYNENIKTINISSKMPNLRKATMATLNDHYWPFLDGHTSNNISGIEDIRLFSVSNSVYGIGNTMQNSDKSRMVLVWFDDTMFITKVKILFFMAGKNQKNWSFISSPNNTDRFLFIYELMPNTTVIEYIPIADNIKVVKTTKCKFSVLQNYSGSTKWIFLSKLGLYLAVVHTHSIDECYHSRFCLMSLDFNIVNITKIIKISNERIEYINDITIDDQNDLIYMTVSIWDKKCIVLIFNLGMVLSYF